MQFFKGLTFEYWINGIAALTFLTIFLDSAKAVRKRIPFSIVIPNPIVEGDVVVC